MSRWQYLRATSARLVTALLAAALLIACDGATASPSAAESYTIDGSFTLQDVGGIFVDEDSCNGTGGYQDVQPGMRVVVTDGSGTTIGTSALEPGTGNTINLCRLVFEVDVPQSDFYAISVGSRGELTYSFDEMEAQDWRVGFTLGS